MSDQKGQEAPAVNEVETPAHFLVKLGNTLREVEGVDVSLVEILAKHLLTAAPNLGAVAQANDAILKLAGERANPLKPEVAGG